MTDEKRWSIPVETDADGRKVISAESAETLQEYFAAHNLNVIVKFHNILWGCLSEKASEYADDVVVRTDLEYYTKDLAAATLLMVYSYLEEDLYLLRKWEAPKVPLARGNSIKRYQPVLDTLGINMGHASWQFLLQATDVRHCLLHANARLDHYIKRSAIEALMARYPEELTERHSRLRVSREFVGRFVEAVRAFQEEVKRARHAREALADPG